MVTPKISIIAAISSNKALGKNGKIPWHISEDLKRFKSVTSGHVVIMGRKTFESIGRPLPSRINIVVTRVTNYQAAGCLVTHSLDQAIKIAKQKEKKEIFIIGGGQIYEQAISLADKLYLTIVEGNFEADTFFPDYSQFKKVTFEQSGESGNFKYKFLDLVRY